MVLFVLIQLLILLHRYLGIAVGALMTMWCLFGVVMMYISYPVLEEHSCLEALAPIDWSSCCTIPPASIGDADRVSKFGVEMLAGRPTLAVRREQHAELINLLTGFVMARVSPEQAARVARQFDRAASPIGAQLPGTVDSDQWAVAGGFAPDRLRYHFALNDAAGTEIYVSSTTGKAVKRTTAHERFWNWLGPIPHWLYFAELRRDLHRWN